MSRAYAEGTKTSVESTRADIERELRRFGADAFNSGFDRERAWIMFQAKGRWIKLVVTLANPKKFTHTPQTGRPRSPQSHLEAVDAENRRLWRCLLLLVKAKLAAVSDGIVEFDEEFLAHTVTKDGTTVYENIKNGLLQIPYRAASQLT